MRKRNHEIKIRLDDQEYARLNAMVAKTVFPREKFLVPLLAGYQLKEEPGVETQALIQQLRDVGHQLTMLDINSKIVEQKDVALLRKALYSVWSADIEIMKAFSPEKLKKKEARLQIRIRKNQKRSPRKIEGVPG